eukprot:jgi/Mesen1/2067/ME000150S01158
MTALEEPEDKVKVSSRFTAGGGDYLEENPMQYGQTVVLKALEKALGSPLQHGPQVPPPQPLVVVISGPSGVGKDAVIKDYYFMGKEQFGEMIAQNELLEHALVYGDYKGIPKHQVRDSMARGTDVVLRLDVQGAATVRQMVGNEALFIFIAAESERALVKRLVERKTEAMDKILARIATAREEMKRIKEFDYVVVNSHNQLDATVGLISSIIDAEKARVCPKKPLL